MHRELLIYGCSKHPAHAHEAKALLPGLWGSWPTQALKTPGMMAWTHAKPLDLFGLQSSWAWVEAVSLHGFGNQQMFHSGQVCSSEQPWNLCRCCLYESHLPHLPFTLSPKVAALRRLLWKDIIILASPSLSLFPASAPHCMVISSHRSLLNLVWKLSRAMRHHYLFCKEPLRAVAE